jgi:hypothetical protein
MLVAHYICLNIVLLSDPSSSSLLNLMLRTYLSDIPTAFQDSTAIRWTSGSAEMALTTSQNEQRRRFVGDVQLLFRDERLLAIVNGVLESSQYLSVVTSVASMPVANTKDLCGGVTARSLRQELIVQYVCRVIYGLGSAQMPASAWRQSDSWGRYKEHKFEVVEAAVGREFVQKLK